MWITDCERSPVQCPAAAVLSLPEYKRGTSILIAKFLTNPHKVSFSTASDLHVSCHVHVCIAHAGGIDLKGRRSTRTRNIIKISKQ